MQTALAEKSEEKKQGAKPSLDHFPENEAQGESLSGALGAAAGMPIFLRGHLQAKLMVGSADDPLEREADSIEEGASAHLPSTAANAHNSSSAPLSRTFRNVLEPMVGADLGDVRVHSDDVAQQAANSINARAFTSGSDIYLGTGESTSDARLVAHESAHVAQQKTGAVPGGKPGVQKKEREGDAPNAPGAGSASASDSDPIPTLRAPQGPGSALASDSDAADIERRLSSTPVPASARDASNVTVAPETHSSLQETKQTAGNLPVPGKGADTRHEGDAGAGAEKGDKAAKADGKEKGGKKPEHGRGKKHKPSEKGAPAAPGPPAQALSPGAEFEGLVDQQTAQYMNQNVSPEKLAALTPVTVALLQSASTLESREIVSPEGVQPAGATEALAEGPLSYAQEEPWVQVVARIRDITSQLGGIVGIIGMVATVSGLILSLLIPPVGAFLLTVGRFCDLAAIILDAVTLVLSGILTGYNLYKLKHSTNPEEKRRLLGLVKQDAMNTFMSGIAVATAVAPGVAKALGKTRIGRVVSRAAQRVTAPLSRAASRVAASIGRSALGRGISSAVQNVSKKLVRLRGTSFIVWANRRAGNLERRALAAFEGLSRRRGVAGIVESRFYQRHLKGTYMRSRRLAEMVNNPIEREFQIQRGRAMNARLQALQGDPNIDAVRTQIEREFGVTNREAVQGGVTTVRQEFDIAIERRGGRYRFGRYDDRVRLAMRQAEMAEIQRIQRIYPGASPEELAQRVNESPFIRGKWTEDELTALQNLSPQPTAVPKTPHHTIPAQVAHQIHRDPRFIQIVNDQRFQDYRAFLQQAYPGVPMVNRGADARALITQGRITGITDPNFFHSDQFVRELQEQGSSGLWRNPRNPSEVYFFNPHGVIGHGWNTRNAGVIRGIFDEYSRQGLGAEAISRTLFSEQAARRMVSLATAQASSESGVAPAIGATPVSDSMSPAPGPQTAVNSELPANQGAAASPAATLSSPSPFLGIISARMSVPVVALGGLQGGPSAPSSSASPAARSSASSLAAAGSGGAPVPKIPELPPAPFLYSPESLAEIRESRISIGAAIEMVQSYIQATHDADHENHAAVASAQQLSANSQQQQETTGAQQQDVTSQQQKLTQAASAQSEMSGEAQKGKSESNKGSSEGQSVQAEGQGVSVEARPEEPEKKSWLERAWDATGGAVWHRLVQPAIRAVKRKVNEVMQKIGEFIMKIISQALGLDKIEAELNAGGSDIQNRQGSLNQTTAGLQQTHEQAAQSQQQNQATVAQAESNIQQSAATRGELEDLLANLRQQETLLAQEEAAAVLYISNISATYREFFMQMSAADSGARHKMSNSADSGGQEEAQPESPEEERVTQSHVVVLSVQIRALQEADQSALREVQWISEEGAKSLSTGGSDATADSSAITGSFSSGQARRSARLAALHSAALDCIGMPLEAGQSKLDVINDEITVIAAEIEQDRYTALQSYYEMHLVSSAAGEPEVS